MSAIVFASFFSIISVRLFLILLFEEQGFKLKDFLVDLWYVRGSRCIGTGEGK